MSNRASLWKTVNGAITDAFCVIDDLPAYKVDSLVIGELVSLDERWMAWKVIREDPIERKNKQRKKSNSQSLQ
jgi:hypothetical protein